MPSHPHILLLRGINVGGKNKLPMKALVALLEGAGYRGVRTYIQSGNVIATPPAGVTEAAANKGAADSAGSPTEITANSAKATKIAANGGLADASQAAAVMADDVAQRIEAAHGFRPGVLVLTPTQLQVARDAVPFPADDPKAVHLFFCAATPTPDAAKLDALKTATEAWAVIDRTAYLHAPDGIGRSKLAARFERHLGTTATARNLRTVDQLLAMLAEGEA